MKMVRFVTILQRQVNVLSCEGKAVHGRVDDESDVDNYSFTLKETDGKDTKKERLVISGYEY